MLSETDLAIIRVEVGASPSDLALEDIFDRRGTVGGVIYDVLAARLAALLATPATFAIPGEYSQSTAANIQALRDSLRRWKAFAPEEANRGSALGVVQLESRHSRNPRRGSRHVSAET